MRHSHQHLALCLLAGVIALAAGSDSEDSAVIDLTTSSFDKATAEGNYLVMFYAPWCGHCAAIKPAYEKLATELKGEVNIGRVDGTRYIGLQARFPVKGYPTIFYIDKAKNVYKFDGQRSQDAMAHFARKGHQAAKALGFWGSPFSIIGVAKGWILFVADYVLVLFEMFKAQGLSWQMAAGATFFVSLVATLIATFTAIALYESLSAGDEGAPPLVAGGGNQRPHAD